LVSGIFACKCIVLESLESPPPLYFLSLSPHPVLFNNFNLFPCVLFLHRCDVFHYCSLSFFSSFLPFLVSSTSPTFGYIFCIYFYVYILLLLIVLAHIPHLRENMWPFGFLNLANFTYDDVLQFIHLPANNKISFL
jgi:hypothetical protein